MIHATNRSAFASVLHCDSGEGFDLLFRPAFVVGASGYLQTYGWVVQRKRETLVTYSSRAGVAKRGVSRSVVVVGASDVGAVLMLSGGAYGAANAPHAVISPR